MSLAIVHSRASCGIQAHPVTLEIHLSNGLPGFSIVGLPEAVVKESKDRVRSALMNTQYEFPCRRITVNLAPADLPKEGARFDLPIALGILAASGQIPLSALAQYEIGGELALSGDIRPIHGALPFALGTLEAGRELILPIDNAIEASLASQLKIYPTQHLLDICSHLSGGKRIAPFQYDHEQAGMKYTYDLADVCGQQQAKRALEIAASGGHSLLMVGPPGAGKTMLASRLPSILPPMTQAEALEVAAVASICGKPIDITRWQVRPFRQPHHTASAVALVGGGNPPKPGEISLSHQGVLFLDELPEYSRQVIETLREPLESGKVTISRAARQAEFPARFQLIAAMNPCPCGYVGDPNHECQCSQEQISRYKGRLSGPFLDRIDMHLEVCALDQNLLFNKDQQPEESSSTVRKRVEQARTRQMQRSECINSALDTKKITQFCQLDAKTSEYFQQTMQRMNFSVRSYHRILRVARTIADIAGEEMITSEHLKEALMFRLLDRKANARI